MLNVFILLTAYYIIKPVREALILSGPGAEIKSYAGAGQAILFWLLLPFYGAFAGRVNRVRLLNGVTAFFISNLLIFYFMVRLGVQFGVAFYRWFSPGVEISLSLSQRHPDHACQSGDQHGRIHSG